jgi:DNA-binding MarR family transcriptional regulator
MESKGLVRRSRETSDRRQVRLLLTIRGKRLIKRLTLPPWAKLQSTGTRFLNILAGIIASADRPKPIRKGVARRKPKHSKRGISTKRKR